VNAKLRAVAASHPRTALADWDEASSEVKDFAGDRIHPGPQGAGVFTETIDKAVRSLCSSVHEKGRG